MNAAMQEVFRSMPNGDPGAAMMQAMQGSQGAITVVVNLVLYAPFPIVLLILMGRALGGGTTSSTERGRPHRRRCRRRRASRSVAGARARLLARARRSA